MPFADGLRREERVEDLGLHLLRHPGAVVVHLEHDRVAVGIVPGPKDQRAAAVCVEHRLFGIDDEVQEDLLDLMRVGEDRRQPGAERFEDRDVGGPLLVGAERQRFAHDDVEVDGRARRVPLARERLQVADDAGGAFGGVVNGVEVAAGQLVEPAAVQPLGAGQDRRERVVQLVRHARHRLAQRRELLGLRQLVVQVARSDPAAFAAP